MTEYSLLCVAVLRRPNDMTEAQKMLVEHVIKRNLEASLFEVMKVELVKES